MTGFDIFDRYDLFMWLLLDAVIAGALVLGVPLWVAVIVVFAACIAAFIRHFDEIMGPAGPTRRGPCACAARASGLGAGRFALLRAAISPRLLHAHACIGGARRSADRSRGGAL